MSDNIKIGLVGCGAISRTHLLALTDQPGVTVTALCDPRAEATAQRREQFKLDAAVFDNFDTFLKEADTDAVILCTPVEAHADQSVAALRAGKHVICEKPMARTAAEAQLVHEAANADGRVYLIDHRFLFDPLLERAVQLSGTPEFGRPHRVKLWMGNTTSPQERPGIYQAGGGCLGDMAYHGIYYVLRILGMPRSVYTVAKTLKHPTDLDDNCAIFLEYDRAMASLEFSFTQEAAGNPHGRPFMVLGEHQSLYADLITNELWVHPDGEHYKPPTEVWTKPLLQHFCDCIAGKAQPIAGAEQGMAAMRVLDAARASASQGKTVTL